MLRCNGVHQQICKVMIGIRTKIESDARRAVVARLVARFAPARRTANGCKTSAETARRLLRQLASAGRAGFASLIDRHGGSPQALLKELRDIAVRGAHCCDTPAQSHAIEAIFRADAHARTVAFATAVGIESRETAREFLALYLVDMARGLLAALEEGATPRLILDAFRTQTADPWRMREWPVAYADRHWTSLRLAPLFAVLHVSAASGNGPAGLIGEFSAANRRVIEMALQHGTGSFVGALFHSGLCQRKLRQFADQQLSSGPLIASLQRTVAAFDSVSLRERQAYRDVIAAAANAAAEAAQERVIFSRGWQLEDEGWALADIQRLIVRPATVRPAATASPSA